MNLDLAGRSVLVAGGSGGIGSVIAEWFARDGANVTIGARNRETLQETANEIKNRTGADVRITEMDITDEGSVDSAVQSVVDATGRLDAVVNSAVDVVGGAPGAPSELDAEVLAHAVDVKVLGALRLIRASLPAMRAAGYGRIIAIGGASARQSGTASAGVRNSALAALCKNISDEVGPSGITVNIIHPGGVLTARNRGRVEAEMERGGGSFEDAEARLSASVPLRRMIHPEDIAPLALFLASPASAAITGQTIAVDGGSTRTITY